MTAPRTFVALGLAFAVAFPPACGHGGLPPELPFTETRTATTLPADPLSTWTDGDTKRAILDFVGRVTQLGNDFVPVDERVAVFDNDGTLWQEKPLVEGAFAVARLERMAAQDPSLRREEPFKSALAHDAAKLAEQGPAATLQILRLTHSGMTDEEFDGAAREFLGSARHPRFDAPYPALVYAPMIELVRLLRDRGFSISICSGGDVDFIRVFSESVYGVPPEHVIGSSFAKELTTVDGRTVLHRLPTIATINDKDAKPVNIDRQLGRRPLFAAGNVGNGGDVAMLRYAHDRRGPSFGLVVQHDDAVREAAYGEKDTATLAAARRFGFHVVSMERDWKIIFPGR